MIPCFVALPTCLHPHMHRYCNASHAVHHIDMFASNFGLVAVEHPVISGRTSSWRRSCSMPEMSLGRFLGEQSDDDDVNEVEMLLEAYFIQVDNTHNKLQTLHEYIDDTEVC